MPLLDFDWVWGILMVTLGIISMIWYSRIMHNPSSLNPKSWVYQVWLARSWPHQNERKGSVDPMERKIRYFAARGLRTSVVLVIGGVVVTVLDIIIR